MAKNKKPTWKEVKSILVDKEKPELLKLIADLYSSSADNKTIYPFQIFRVWANTRTI